MPVNSALAPRHLHIIIPCRNCGQWLAQCLASLVSQERDDWSATVADDASTDGTVNAARDYLSDPRITFLRQRTRLGLMGNTLSALDAAAPGPRDVVAILDGDDMLLPGALARVMQTHALGYDVVWTDMQIQGTEGSTGAPLIPGIPVRQQLWCLSQLRTFKGYLLDGLDRTVLCDDSGQPVRAAGDLALYFALIERAGVEKTAFIPEKLYWYRQHAANNCAALREEQLANNARLRALPPLPRQTQHFDVHITALGLEKLRLRAFGQSLRADYPLPYSICVHHDIGGESGDSWAAYHDKWIAEGVYLTARPNPQTPEPLHGQDGVSAPTGHGA
jgi:hypothetical protein